MAQQPGQRIVGYDNVEVVGLGPRQGLQNISGDNWPNPPRTCDRVTYCYLRAPPINGKTVAKKLEATLHTEPVYVDNYR